MAGVPPSRLDSLMNRMTIDSSSSGIASMNSLLVEMNDLLKAKEAKKDERTLLNKPALQMDVLFVLDATVSMAAPNRDAVVRHLVTVVDLLSSMLKHSTVSVGVVAYRDFKLNPRFEVFPFTKLSGGEDGGLVAARA
ncbi:hypothetical protein CEUSTIGMA_g4853.t1 [Chlamydomonas eustigma]|uniref:VWFA domain-containing protein n=1 Tax=Chlamydomonas eustigma TaxID=1157962 RepID=A0A250X2W0_9CHLO|nr:hypothetical protein CEUSTIGMA_g4853.t1 [Chlamydomonas eustigma]|eukprot:GAX77407.1 hypothetical protein CEUSTIGMA_g4853.t1 [Chlamydomonas eustigma]